MEKQTVTLLLFFKKEKPFFIASQRILPESGQQSASSEKAIKLKARILEYYNNFKEHFDPQENVCSTLHAANQIVLIHPGNLKPDESSAILENFLKVSRKKHGTWLVVDTILALLGCILTPIPGPNLVFFLPAARAVSHYFAKGGVTTALALEKKDFTTNPLLDTIQENIGNLPGVRDEIAELEELSRCSHIQRLLK